MKMRALLPIFGLAMVACESPTDQGDFSGNTQVPPAFPQEPENTDTLRLTGMVTLNGIPRTAVVELARSESVPCPFVPYSFGCWPTGTSVVEASSQTDAEGRYEISGVLSASETLSCADYRSLRVTFTDPGLHGMYRTESLGDDVCGDVEVDLAFAYLGVRGVLRIDGEPAPQTLYYDHAPKVLVRYADGTVDDGKRAWVEQDGEFGWALEVYEFDSALCGHYDDATLQLTLPDGRSSEPVLFSAPDDCALRPFFDVEVDI